VLENLEVGASYKCNILIYKKSSCGFIPFGFPRKILVYRVSMYDVMHCLWLYVYDMLNAIISERNY
jgi:hypothetical protein